MQRNGVEKDQRLSFSVIIPTKYRPDTLGRAVESVLRQTIPPHELVIVDQSVDNTIRRRAEAEYDHAPEQVRRAVTLTYIHDERIPGAAAARNRGMDVATGQIWLFLDDDVYLEPDFVDQLAGVYLGRPEACGVSGVFTNYPPRPLGFRLWACLFIRGPFHDERQPVYWRADQLRNGSPIRVTKFTGALMSFRADAIRHLRFDESVHGTSAEDADFCMRLSRGAVLLIAPAARLFHHRSPDGRSRRHWVQVELEKASYLYWRHWSRGLKNRLCFTWLIAGHALAAIASSLRRGSLLPCEAIPAGIREGAEEARASRTAVRISDRGDNPTS